jgi:hypothetical protein
MFYFIYSKYTIFYLLSLSYKLDDQQHYEFKFTTYEVYMGNEPACLGMTRYRAGTA